jgi:hypothetical protein
MGSIWIRGSLARRIAYILQPLSQRYPFQGHASTITESGRVYVLSNQLTLRGCILCYTHLVTFQFSESAAGGT